MQNKLIVAAGGLVFNTENKLLMIFRRGFWDLPKGKLDEGETISECATREVNEETGLQNIVLKELIGITYHDYFDKWTKQDVTKETHWYKMLVQEEQNLIPQTEEDIEKIEWADKRKVLEYLQNTYHNIVEIVKKSGYLD